MEEIEKKKKIFYVSKIIVPLIIAILSFAIFSNFAVSNKINNETIVTLQEKQEKVLKLSAASTAIAAGASLVLGDRATALSNKLLDLTGYFIIILSAILLEKYLVAMMGLISFKILIPIACILFSIFTIIDRESMRKFSLKLVTFAIVAFVTIPFSVMISNVIENTYDNTINKSIEEVESLRDELDTYNSDLKDGNLTDENTNQTKADEDTDINVDKNWYENLGDNVEKFFSGAKDKVISTVGNVANTITSKAKVWIDKLTTQLNNMIDAIAVMIVTTCVIPLLVIVFFIWIVKMLFNINIDSKKIPKLSELRK